MCHNIIGKTCSNTSSYLYLQVKEKEFHEIGEVKVMMIPLSDNVVRLVTHYDLSKCDVELVIRKLKFVIEEYDNMLELNFDKQNFVCNKM